MRANGDAPHVVQMSDVGLDVSGDRDPAGRGLGPEVSTSYGQSNLAFRDISFAISVRKGTRRDKTPHTEVILAPISGAFDAGNMVALIGPSGCGKTTLLDIIAGKKTAPHEGQVFLNGRPRDKLYSRVTSYVPQQDVMPSFCTVREVVEFNHRLRVDLGDTPLEREERQRIVNEVLGNFGLLRVKDQLIGDAYIRGISGGQKRRTTLARGFVGGAQIVFADEPTSGLSATDAELCVRAMRRASESKGVTFVVVIHQPRVEVAQMFDHLLLMTANPGRVVYNGPFRDAAAYFTKAGHSPEKVGNPSDYYLDVITPDIAGNAAEEMAGLYLRGQAQEVELAVRRQIEAGGKSPLVTVTEAASRLGVSPRTNGKRQLGRHSVSWKTQIVTLMKRRLTLTLRDTRHLKIRFSMASLQGLIVGLAFLDIGKKLPIQQLSFLFMLLQIGALSNMAVMPETIAQRLVFKFENSDGLYSTAAAVVVDTAVGNTLAVVGNFITTLIMFSLSGLDWGMFGMLYFWSIAYFVVMVNYFKIVGAVAPSHAESLQVAMPGLMLFILFNNFFVNQATVPSFMRWALYVSPMAWSVEQIITGLYPHDAELKTFYGYDDSSGQTVMALSVLVGEAILFQAIALVCLAKMNNIQR
mmetsp:Transcript_12595/g.47076  ORF Transcript_12595/g.47076 Transcript_12595/m.47076 type:complete len:638 (+) Transcript_12595:47-1960(+)